MTLENLLLWFAQLAVAVFFIAGFVSFHMELWSHGYHELQRSRQQRLFYRISIMVLSFSCSALFNGIGYFSDRSAMLYHNIGLFILILVLLDEKTNIVEYLLRCLALIAVWSLYYWNNILQWRFGISLAIVVVMLILIRYFRQAIGSNFPRRLIVAVVLAADFWFNLPIHPQGMVVTPLTAVGAVLMFFLMKLSTGRQQQRFFANLATVHLANYDELTSTKNFTAYQNDIFNYFGSAHTKQRPLAVALLDIDHFKLVNDQYGHLAGNQVLTDVAQGIKRILQQYDDNYQIYRTGGEEFTLVFPDSSDEEAFPVLLHCWQKIRAAKFTYDQTSIKVTISAGLTAMRSGDQSPNTVYKRADDSLYSSKKNGRDTITIDGVTQQLADDSAKVAYAYFARGVYLPATATEQRRVANELQLHRYDQRQQAWQLAQRHLLDIDTRIELMRQAQTSSRCTVMVISVTIADFLEQRAADKMVAFFNSPDGPTALYIELDQLPALELMTPMINFYHQNNVQVILSQIGSNRHFEQISSSLQYLDGIKFIVPPADGPAQARKDILFWSRIAADWQVKFAVDGITAKPLLDWLRQQKCADYVEGDYFGKPQLPLLHE